MFKRLRNIILIGLALVAIAGVVRVVSASRQASTAQASATVQQETAKVDRGDIALTVSGTGTIQANQTVSLTFAASGTVKTITVAEGAHVLKGQTIATLDTTSATDALLQAQAQLETEQIALQALTDKARQVDIDVDEAALTLAQAQLKEAGSGTSATTAQIDALKAETAKNSLWQTQLQRDANDQARATAVASGRPNAASAFPSDQANNANLQASEYDVQIAQANLAADTTSGASLSSIASAQASVTSAQITLDNLLNGGNTDDVTAAKAQVQAAQHALDAAKADLAKTSLIAPFDGVIATLNLHIGEAAPSSDAVIMLDTSSFSIDVPVDETDISQVTIGQSVALTLDALPGVKVNGKVAQIAATSTLSGNVVTYTVHITVDPAGQALRAAMSATADITTQKTANALRAPNRFITLDKSTGKSFVGVRQSDGTFKTVEVTVGLRNGTYTEIKSGLSEGDIIAAAQVTTSSSGASSNSAPGGVGLPGLGGPGGPGGGGPSGPPPA